MPFSIKVMPQLVNSVTRDDRLQPQTNPEGEHLSGRPSHPAMTAKSVGAITRTLPCTPSVPLLARKRGTWTTSS
jgi:hypothetical protein